MSLDLVDSTRNLFTADVISRAATQLGEADTNVQKAIHGLIPSALTGILYQAGSDAGASNILAYSRDAANTAPPVSFGSTVFAPGAAFAPGATDWGHNLFGDKTAGLAALVAAYAAVRESSALSLLNAVIPAAYSVIGQYAGANNLGPGGVVALLHDQRDRIISAVPSGIPVAGILGLPALADVGERIHRAHAAYARPSANHHYREHRKRSFPVALVFVILIIIIGAAWFFLSGNHDTKNRLTTSDTTVSTIPTADTVVTTTTTTTSQQVDTIKH
ncbi:hypothetical protein DCC81_17160 [Chitinophaga parva]|uniref:DUF937 domain-containing protein n=1 Tax=Chitinophaga parva TaxID=2169414 RepID=A0A2T7BI95_9BACT|nr:DUF937 domain-containing protein [Chitinophaga parva]PUZ25973.1 hypothetical protein DCC81_17160 [Chitinophaga parva]